MKKLFFGGVALIALGAAGSALAADMRVKAPPPAPVATWTGVYLGVNGGYGLARSTTSLGATNVVCNPCLGACDGNLVAGEALPADVISAFAVPGGLGTHPRGGLVGGTFGFNQQFGYWVAGIETDLDWASIRGSTFRSSSVVLNPAAPAGTPFTSFNGAATASTRLSDFGTLRARLGFTPWAPLLVYGTGGLAFGRVTSDAAVTEVSVGPCGLNLAAGAVGGCPFTPAAFRTSSTRVGWTAGAGAEYMLFGQWSLKAEYLYFDLSGGNSGANLAPLASLGNCAAAPAAAVPCPFTTANVVAAFSDLKGSIVRVGLNYKFGPVATPY